MSVTVCWEKKERQKKELVVTCGPHVWPFKLNCFFSLYLLYPPFLMEPEAILGSHRSPAVRKIDKLLDWPCTGNQIKKRSLSANPTAINNKVKDTTDAQKSTVNPTDTYSNPTWRLPIYLKNSSYNKKMCIGRFVIVCLCHRLLGVKIAVEFFSCFPQQ